MFTGRRGVQKNYISFGTFVALFPQLIAGPIVRYKDISDQLDYRSNSAAQFASGVQRFTVGLAKKVLIANNVGVLWDTYAAVGASELTVVGAWLGIAAFTLQIYFDFSGYSDMAIGLGRMLGFEFKENFNYPYVSQSVTEFWRRWHISLGTWFRDYVYIPLGGNRHGLRRQLLNILIVWALTGIWHGANWTFLLWGLYYALFLILEKTFLLKAMEKWPPVLRHIYTIVIVMAGWVIFQLDTLSAVGAYLGAMFGLGQAGFAAGTDLYYLGSYAVTFAITVFFCTPAGKLLFAKLPEKVRSVAAPALIVLVLIVSTAYLVDSTYNPFLYFRF
jgi:alginate O-acetyltransferase complex protein AlgI